MRRNRPFRLALVIVTALVAMVAGTFGPATATHAAAAVSLSRNYAAPGDKVTVNGNGFHAGDDVVVSSDMVVAGKSQHVQTSSTADGNGTFSAVLTVPQGTAQHTYTVTAKDFHGTSASHWLAVLPLAYIVAGGTPHIVYVIPTHSLYVSGKGFQPNETITIKATFPQYDGNSGVAQKSVQANKNGAFYEAVLKIPNDAKAGTTTISATGDSSKKSGQDNIRVVYRPFIRLGSGTVRPGTNLTVKGREFVPNTNVRVFVTLPRNGDTNVALSRTVLADGSGNFSTTLSLPSNVRVGKYTARATDTTGNFSAAAPFQVSVNPSISVKPNTVYAGQSFTVSGSNFGAGVSVRVSASFPIGNGKNQDVAKTVTTGQGGNYSATLTAPGNANAGKVTVTAASSNSHVTASVSVRVHPTAVPTATATSAPKAAPTATATAKPTHHHKKHKKKFDYRYVSVWYHTVRVGTYNHLVVQSTLKIQLGIWVHVYFPSGQHLDFYQNTDHQGKWELQFNIPTNALAGANHSVLVTFRLWHGKSSIKQYAKFSLVR
jgi:hypothetical protein